MADEETTTETSGEVGGGENPELSSARESFSRAAEKAGLATPEGEADRGSAGVATGETGDSGAPAEPAAGQPDFQIAHNQFNERLRTRREANRQERLYQALAKVAERAAAEPQAAAAPAGPDTNPFDRETEYWDWLGWEQNALKTGIVSELDARLKPILSFAQSWEQQQQRQTEEARVAEERQAWLREQGDLARQAHDVYVATEEGQGYLDRVNWHIGTPGDPARGIPAQDGALTIGFLAAGFPEHVAQQLSLAHKHAMHDLAIRHGLNPAAALDRFTRAQIAAAADYLGITGGNGHGQAQRTVEAPAPPPNVPARARVAAAKQTAQAAVAGSVSEAGPEGGKDLKAFLRTMASQERLGVNEMKQLAKRFGVPPQQLARMLQEEAAKIGAS